jgi:molybdopterin-biosynthesis enzyme MoeA-like protein
MAKFCFSLGMALKRIEVIGDGEEEIVEATRRMSKDYDFVVTSGGIGPTSVASLTHSSLIGSTLTHRQTRRHHLSVYREGIQP